MKHPPGSFTKNFAWHGAGFSRLHKATRAGFSDRLQAVAADEWRKNCGEPSRSLQLVPLNFFLYQVEQGGKLVLPVDEIVYKSLYEPHSATFDRLALFAFHLNIAGSTTTPTGARGWAPWANEFVREDLWTHPGGWQTERLTETKLKAALQARIDSKAITKCYTNYRYFFRLAGYLASAGPYVNSGYDEWLASALFLTWDRWLMENPSVTAPTRDILADAVTQLEIHKLVGSPLDVVSTQGEALADTYLELGAVWRFGEDAAIKLEPAKAGRRVIRKKTPPAPPVRKTYPPKLTDKQLASLRTVQSDATVERQAREYYTQVRNKSLAATIKQLYGGKCVFCETLLQVGKNPDVYYVEAAHVKPLGSPHNGPDKTQNIIPLCPNHHLQFDRGMLRLEAAKGFYKIHSQIDHDALHGKQLALHKEHNLDPVCVQYHFDWFDPPS